MRTQLEPEEFRDTAWHRKSSSTLHAEAGGSATGHGVVGLRVEMQLRLSRWKTYRSEE